MSKNILIINGANLNLLGSREPAIYGKLTLEDIHNLCKERGKKYGANIDCVQSNSEGEIINTIHNAKQNNVDAIIINAGAYSHTSIAIMDALLAVKIDTIEVHLSNIHTREDFRSSSYIAKAAKGVITGLKEFGYLFAIDYICNN